MSVVLLYIELYYVTMSYSMNNRILCSCLVAIIDVRGSRIVTFLRSDAPSSTHRSGKNCLPHTRKQSYQCRLELYENRRERRRKEEEDKLRLYNNLLVGRDSELSTMTTTNHKLSLISRTYLQINGDYLRQQVRLDSLNPILYQSAFSTCYIACLSALQPFTGSDRSLEWNLIDQ